MIRSPRILVLTLSFGSGHVQAAKAVANELCRQEPNSEVKVIDALATTRVLFRAFYVWPYWLMVRYAPALWNRFFRRRLKRLHRRTAPEWAFRFGCPQIFAQISDHKPETIVATEVAASEITAIAKRRGLTDARIVNVITDYEAEPVWVQREADRYAVPDQYVRDQLATWGASPEDIIISGIPAESAFLLPHDARSTRIKYKFADAPVVLLMGGGMGPTRMDEVAAFLLLSGQRIQIVAVAGNDKRARRRLERLRPLPQTPLCVIGWTEDVPALMQIASVLITKPGGLTTAEAAISALPTVMFDAIPGPEQRNAQRVAHAGAGVIAKGARQAAQAALSLLADETARQRMSASAKNIAAPDAAKMIARVVLNRSDVDREVAKAMTA
ncbi:MAG TPA: glycosyltransferase [Pyrinomonadaceae bacterium]